MENGPFKDDFPSYKPLKKWILHGYISHNQMVHHIRKAISYTRLSYYQMVHHHSPWLSYIYIHIVPDIINIYPRYILRTYYTPYHITPRYVYVLSGGGRQLLLRRHHGSTLRGGGSPGGARTEYVRYTVGKTIEKWENPRKNHRKMMNI